MMPSTLKITAHVALILLIFFPMSVGAHDYKQSKTLMETTTTVIGEQIHYPGGAPAEIKSMIIVMLPGEATSWHKHGVPLYAYILSGELEVDYGSAGKRTYHAGENFMEAMGTFHQGHSVGQNPVRILAVFMGGEGQPLVIQEE